MTKNKKTKQSTGHTLRKAVFPAAGLGTRFLPATKAIPKEMLPLVDKPLIQYTVEEARDSGLEEIILITGMGKNAIEDHFDSALELEMLLKKKGDKEMLRIVEEIGELVHYTYTRQKRPLGLGHAIQCAENLVRDEAFAVFLGDDIIESKVPAMRQMMDVFEAHGKSVLAVQKVPKSQTHLYGMIKGKKVGPGLYRVTDLVEKPKGKAPSNLAIIGRYILTPNIFKALRKTKPGRGGEIQLTDALKKLLKDDDIYALEFEGERFDAGDKLGFIKANISLALRRPELKRELKSFIKSLKL
jgi:UTP--glucose-1-phosphate uridylyltransferase